MKTKRTKKIVKITSNYSKLSSREKQKNRRIAKGRRLINRLFGFQIIRRIKEYILLNDKKQRERE